MKQFKGKLVIGLVVAVLLMSVAVWAMSPYLKVFTDTYNIKKETTLGGAGCSICHTTKGGGKLNPYGLDIDKAVKADKGSGGVTKAILTSVEALDSDKDGKSNIDEIKADTLPGDPKSHK
jgi:hypothetical protein